MGKSRKVLCKWSKSDLRKNTEALLALTEDASHICLDCGRSANDKKVLCEPQSRDKLRG